MDYYARCNQEPILKRNVSINYLTVKPKSSNYAAIIIETGPGQSQEEMGSQEL